MLTYITCFDGSYLHKRDPYPYITSEQLQYADQLWIIKKNTSFKMIHHHSAKIKKNYAHTHHIPISSPTTLPMQGTMRGGESASGTSVSHFSRQVGVAWGKEVA